MEAYKFETMIQENGIIQIPEIARFAHQEAEIFIVVKPKTILWTERLQEIEEFLDKWGGILRDSNPDDLKAEYLQEKYE